MQYLILLALPLLALAEPEASPNPQGFLAALNPVQRACECPKEQQYSPCSASACECRNRKTLECWQTRNAPCSVALLTCPGETSLQNDFPACGKGLPGCPAQKICRKVNYECNERVTGCLGFCVAPPQPKPTPTPQALPANPFPNYTPPTPKQSQPKQGQSTPKNPFNPLNWIPNAPPQQPAQGSPQAARCPAAQARTCKQNEVCVVDPHDTLGPLRGTVAFKCTDGLAQCGGFQNTQCPEGKLCVGDPRIQCIGQGCTGLCA